MAFDRRRLNIGVFERGDVVRYVGHAHSLQDMIYVVLGDKWRSELLYVLNVNTNEEELIHPMRLDRYDDNAMIVLAAATLIDCD